MSKNSDLHRTKKDFQSTGEGDKKKKVVVRVDFLY